MNSIPDKTSSLSHETHDMTLDNAHDGPLPKPDKKPCIGLIDKRVVKGNVRDPSHARECHHPNSCIPFIWSKDELNFEVKFQVSPQRKALTSSEPDSDYTAKVPIRPSILIGTVVIWTRRTTSQ
jgi:hypothetical protein